MANIISMKDVTSLEGERFTMDTKKGTQIIVSMKDGTILEFKQFSNRVYQFDTAVPVIKDKPKSQVTDYSMLQTIENSKTYFTIDKVKGAIMHEYSKQLNHIRFQQNMSE